MNLNLTFAELPLSRLCAASSAISHGMGCRGAVIEGAPPGVPVQRKSSA